MRTFYFCYECGSTVRKTDSLYECPECGECEVFSSAHMTFFNYEMTEFLNPVFQESDHFWWEESMVYEYGSAIYLVRLPRNFGMIPRNKISVINGSHQFSRISLDEIG